MVLFRKSFGKSLSQSWDQNRPEPIKNWIYNQSETQIMTSGAFQVLNTNVCVCVCVYTLIDGLTCPGSGPGTGPGRGRVPTGDSALCELLHSRVLTS